MKRIALLVAVVMLVVVALVPAVALAHKGGKKHKHNKPPTQLVDPNELFYGWPGEVNQGMIPSRGSTTNP